VTLGLLLAVALAVGLLGAARALAPRRALRVLMYHRIGHFPERDAVPAQVLDRQIGWLQARGYRFVRLSEVLAHREQGAPLPPRAVLLTFDDGTVDHLEVALPLLRRRGVPAVFFVTPGLAGGEVEYADRRVRVLDVAGLRALTEGGAELGLHSWAHANLARAPLPEVAEDARRALAFFAAHGLPVIPALAYPFGAYPRRQPDRDSFFASLASAGVKLAFRIGNRLNRTPISAPFEIQRIGIRRRDGMVGFALKVALGRARPFS
jgi:peptidoglycan/xylan/chitin deacetylase (PgdA/CDA1 family)